MILWLNVNSLKSRIQHKNLELGILQAVFSDHSIALTTSCFFYFVLFFITHVEGIGRHKSVSVDALGGQKMVSES